MLQAKNTCVMSLLVPQLGQVSLESSKISFHFSEFSDFFMKFNSRFETLTVAMRNSNASRLQCLQVNFEVITVNFLNKILNLSFCYVRSTLVPK